MFRQARGEFEESRILLYSLKNARQRIYSMNEDFLEMLCAI